MPDVLKKITESTRLAGELQAVGDRILKHYDIERVRQTEVEEVAEFVDKFAAFQASLSFLPLEGWTPPKGAKEDPARVLADAIGRLIETHEKIIGIVKGMNTYTHERMKVLRESREVFDKFVRARGGMEPRFYDKKG